MKACRDSIEALKNSIGREEKQAYGANWLQALGRGSPNTDCIAHQHGVVGIKITLGGHWQSPNLLLWCLSISLNVFRQLKTC